MTDREMLELAAKAAGVELKYDTFGQSKNAERVYCYWNPLVDDGDALRLAVVVGIEIGNYHQYGRALAVLPTGCEYWEVNPDDPCAATRRAITRAAAEIGKAMQEATS